MANDLQSLAHTKWNCKYHTMLVKRCFFSAFGDGIMQMIRVEVVRELIFLYSMLACYNPTGYA